MINIWRLHTITDGENVGKYCIQNRVIALGWSMCDAHIENEEKKSYIIAERQKIREFKDYEKLITTYNLYGGKVNDNVNRLVNNIKENDLIWVREKGIYYLGRVTKKSSYIYKIDEFTLKNDATNQLNNIDWYEIGDVSKVPGSLANKFISGKTLQRIRNKAIELFSKLKYNEKSKSEIYICNDFDVDEDFFYSLLTPDDVEDLLALWLYKQFNYITIPSTNKRSTELYEYVMIDPRTGKNIFTQVKQGYKNIDANDYKDLKGEVWLLTTGGEVKNKEVSLEIKVSNPNEIENFAISEENHNLLPEKIKSCVRYYNKIKHMQNKL